MSFLTIIIEATRTHIKPESATVVNLGVSFLHLSDTEKTEKPTDEVIPKTSPIKELFSLFSIAIIIIPMVAIIIAIQTLIEILSFKNRKPNNAVKNGIAARQSKVTAALVLVIENIKVIIATPSPMPPINPDTPIFK